MRESAPVAFEPAEGLWSVFRYDDVERVLSEHASFSSRFGFGENDQSHPLAASLIATDPPRHRQLRSLVSQAFTPRAIARLAPRIEALTRELLDRVAGADRIDVVDDLAYPLPVIVIAELLGIPASDQEAFKRWSDFVVTGQSEIAAGRRDQAMLTPIQEMSAYFLARLAERRAAPGEDLISGLLAAQDETGRLNDLDVLAFCILLLVAGNETTTNLIANAVLCFEEFPEVVAQLRADPELLPSAIEEVLRYRSPVQMMFRTVARDTLVGDQTMRVGQRVIAWIGSANRDPSQFPNPDVFDARRTPNRHLAFGDGIHFCLGAPLARLEARIVLRQLLARFPNLRVAPGARLESLGGHVVYGVKHLPVTLG
jgi:cytochrome P450